MIKIPDFELYIYLMGITGIVMLLKKTGYSMRLPSHIIAYFLLINNTSNLGISKYLAKG